MSPSEKIDILLVDDREDGLTALEAVLSSPRYNLVCASSGRAALELVEKYDFAVILMDVQMPDLDGFQTASRIKNNSRLRHIPIIFVTAINKEDRYIFKGYETGAVDYVFKPFDPHILRSKVAVFADLYLKSRQLREQAEMLREGEHRERNLKLAQLELENLRRYRNLADAIPHIVWKSSGEGVADYFNKVWTDYTGMSLEASTGSGWQSAVHPQDLPLFLKEWLNAILESRSFEVECRIRRRDGQYRWHLVRSVPEKEVDGAVIAWLGTSTDIHDRKLIEEHLREAQTEAVEANRAKTAFLANMSHEIRTPLGAMLGFAELLLRPDLPSEERMRSISTIRRNGQQLVRLIDEILDISKVEAGRVEIESIAVDLPDLISDLRSLLQIAASEKGIGLNFSVQSPVPSVLMTDPTRLRQILMNVIGNAVKFTTQGSVDVEIRSVDADSGQELHFVVKDTGVGISKAQWKRLFEPFSQVDGSTTRRFGGTGLGLALSRRLARLLGGDVWLDESESGAGSIFAVRVPLSAVDGCRTLRSSEDLKIERIVAETVQIEVDLNGVSLLVVDDAPDNRVLISRFLSHAGARVDLATNGEEGVQMALENDYHLVLMDIQMPLVDGYEATSRLRSLGYDRPIIALTAHALKEERQRCLQVGCSDHLTKPIERRVLLERVARFAREENSANEGPIRSLGEC